MEKWKCSNHKLICLYIEMIPKDKIMFLWSKTAQYNGIKDLQDF